MANKNWWIRLHSVECIKTTESGKDEPVFTVSAGTMHEFDQEIWTSGQLSFGVGQTYAFGGDQPYAIPRKHFLRLSTHEIDKNPNDHFQDVYFMHNEEGLVYIQDTQGGPDRSYYFFDGFLKQQMAEQAGKPGEFLHSLDIHEYDDAAMVEANAGRAEVQPRFVPSDFLLDGIYRVYFRMSLS
ncbi:MAG: hypothetical protein H6918_02445 [Sphingomonadaceae bacterium]|nr:hypothetical protein [Sphingomonadaceae bacterium]